MKEIKRVSAGVMFESDVLAFIDQLASTQQRNRSFIINNIIRYYSRMTQPVAAQPEPAVSLLNPQSPEAAPLIRF
jgi:hypothetical protein